MLSHEKLNVYSKALQFAAKANDLCTVWDDKHALVDHLRRAAESILVNLAEAARVRSLRPKLTTVDYAIGSSLECSGCLDIAHIKKLIEKLECDEEKRRLCEITKMLVGLRKGWENTRLNEEPIRYQSKEVTLDDRPLFHHETLNVYQTALRFVDWFESRTVKNPLPVRAFRQLDESATSIVLNIAEGNGRYAELDHQRFLEIAQSAAVKAAAYLDLSFARKLVLEEDLATGKDMLRSIVAMLGGM